MKNLSNKWTQLFSAFTFLVLMLAQPVHQISHLEDHHHPTFQSDTQADSGVFNNENCDLCSFHFAPILELTIDSFPVLIKDGFYTTEKTYSKENKFSSLTPITSLLRGPPSFA